MRALDIGCGAEPELWFSGADLCDIDIAPDSEYSPEELAGRQIFRQCIDADSPKLPVEDGTYDFIFCGSAWDWMTAATKSIVVKEMSRILKVGGRAIVRDLKYLESDYPEWETFEVHAFLKELQEHFPEEEWFSFTYYNERIDVHESVKGCNWIIHLEKL